MKQVFLSLILLLGLSYTNFLHAEQSSLQTNKLTSLYAEAKEPQQKFNVNQRSTFAIGQIIELQKQITKIEQSLQQFDQANNDIKELEKLLQGLTLELASLKAQITFLEKSQVNQLEDFDKRISDSSLYTNMWGIIFSAFALIITIFAVFLGFSTRNKAKLEAQEAAEEHMTNWLDTHKTPLLEEAKQELGKVSVELKTKVLELEKTVRKQFEQLHQEQKSELDKNKEEWDKAFTLLPKPISKELEEEKLARPEEFGANKLEINFFIMEKFKEGVKAYSKRDYEVALENWGIVLNSDIQKDDELYVMSLKNKALTLKELSNFNEALATFELIIKNYGDSQKLIHLEQVAAAMVGKGAILGQFNLIESELEVYDELIAKFNNNQELIILEQLASAMLNKSIALGQLGKFDDVISVSNSLIERFELTSELVILNLVVKAMVNKAVVLGLQDDIEGKVFSYDALITRFRDINKAPFKEYVTNSMASNAELSLLIEPTTQVLERIQLCENFTDDKVILAIMAFLRFIVSDIVLDELIEKLEELSNNTEFTWQFNELEKYFNSQFKGEKRQQIEAIVQYFEQHHDLSQLKADLALK